MSTKSTNGANVSTQQGIAPVTTSTAGAIIAAMHGNGTGGLTIPKPFSHPICLVPSTRVAGTTHVKGIRDLANHLAEGDRLRLQRDAHNHYDQWAIKVFDASNNRLGFVSADVNEIPARLMDGGKSLFAEVVGVELVDSWVKIEIGVWLDD